VSDVTDVRSESNVKSLLHLDYSRSFSRYVIIVINKTTEIVKDKVTAIVFSSYSICSLEKEVA